MGKTYLHMRSHTVLKSLCFYFVLQPVRCRQVDDVDFLAHFTMPTAIALTHMPFGVAGFPYIVKRA
jgi:hypothetical protein